MWIVKTVVINECGGRMWSPKECGVEMWVKNVGSWKSPKLSYTAERLLQIVHAIELLPNPTPRLESKSKAMRHHSNLKANVLVPEDFS